MRIGILFAFLGGLVIFGTSAMSDPGPELERYDELMAGAGEHYTATITDHFEKTQRSRRSSTTVYCPVYTYTEINGEDSRERNVKDYDVCAKTVEEVGIANQVPIVVDPESQMSFRADSEGRSALKGDVTSYKWMGILGWGIGVLGVLIIIGSLISRFRPSTESANGEADDVSVP